jgi:hypothetical protein
MEGERRRQLASGANFSDLVRSMGPTFGEIGDRMAAAGIEGSEAFDRIRGAAALVTGETTGPMISSVDAAIGVLRSMSNVGTEELAPTFVSVGAHVRETFDALIAGGADGKSAMIALEGPIATLIALQDEHGFTIDESTQRLIDNARQAGVAGEAQKSAQDRTADAVERLAEIFEDVFTEGMPRAVASGASAMQRSFGGALDSMASRARNMPPVTMPLRYAAPRLPEMPELPSFQGGTGGRFVDFGAGLGSLVRLHGREAIVPEGQAGPGSDALAREIHALRSELQTDRAFQAQLVPKMLAAAMAQHGVAR